MFCNCEFLKLKLYLFLDNQFDTIDAPELTVQVGRQLRLELWRQNVFPEISNGVAGGIEEPLVHAARWQRKAFLQIFWVFSRL